MNYSMCLPLIRWNILSIVVKIAISFLRYVPTLYNMKIGLFEMQQGLLICDFQKMLRAKVNFFCFDFCKI